MTPAGTTHIPAALPVGAERTEPPSREEISAFARREHVSEWELRPAAPEEPTDFNTQFGTTRAGVSLAGLFLEIENDEHGVIVTDTFGAAIATGASPAEALQAWTEAAHEHYQDLANNEVRLHPRLHEQLLFLRKFFG